MDQRKLSDLRFVVRYRPLTHCEGVPQQFMKLRGNSGHTMQSVTDLDDAYVFKSLFQAHYFADRFKFPGPVGRSMMLQHDISEVAEVRFDEKGRRYVVAFHHPLPGEEYHHPALLNGVH